MQKTTLVLVLIALGLGGYVYFYEIRSRSQEEITNEAEKRLFSFSEEDIQRLIIDKVTGETFEFVRLETAASSWRMKQPEGSPAEESAVVFLLDLLVKERSSKTFTVEADQLKSYGLEDPFATIQIELQDQTKHQVVLGNPTFDNEEIYAQVNPEESNTTADIYILPINFQYAVERSLSEWKDSPASEEEETPESDSPSPPSEEESPESDLPTLPSEQEE